MENNVVDEKTEVVSDDMVSPMSDYYDRYYENVTKNLNTIVINQDKLLEKQAVLNNLTFGLFFLLGLFLIYYLLRNMITIRR